MENKKTKHEIDNEDEDDEDDFKIKPMCQISLGDITITSKSGLPKIHKTIKTLLNDKQIKRYLDIYSKRKIMSSLSYIG